MNKYIDMQVIHTEYMMANLYEPGRYKLDQFKALSVIDKALSRTVGNVSEGVIYKKMSQRLSKEVQALED
jgi:hypothetical protein